MTAQLSQIQNTLKDIVMQFIEAQRMDLEGEYDTKVNAAETHLRVIANKRAPYLIFQLMQQLHITQAIELDRPVASAEYVVQIMSTMTKFESIWESHLSRYGKLAEAQLTLNGLNELLAEAQRNYNTLHEKVNRS